MSPVPSGNEAAPSLALDRALAIIELLAAEPVGLPLLGIVERLGFPRSATHRLLTGLAEHGYVRQDRERGFYFLTPSCSRSPFPTCGAGIVDAAQPVLDRLAQETGELVRLSVVEGDRLTWVAKAQGARSGLRYDPEMGLEAQLSCSATGFAWLSSKPDGRRWRWWHGRASARATISARTRRRRRRRCLRISAARASAATARGRTYRLDGGGGRRGAASGHGEVIGTVSIAGPVSRLPETRLHDLAPLLLAAAGELSAVMLGSPALAQHAGAGRPHHLRKVSDDGSECPGRDRDMRPAGDRLRRGRPFGGRDRRLPQARGDGRREGARVRRHDRLVGRLDVGSAQPARGARRHRRGQGGGPHLSACRARQPL